MANQEEIITTDRYRFVQNKSESYDSHHVVMNTYLMYNKEGFCVFIMIERVELKMDSSNVKARQFRVIRNEMHIDPKMVYLRFNPFVRVSDAAFIQ